VAQEAPAAADELEQAQEAIDREIMRREVEDGAAEETVAPEAAPAEEDAVIEEAPETPVMEDEIVAPEPSVDEGMMEESPTEESAEDDIDMELQYGIDGQLQAPLTPEQIEARRKLIEQERIQQEQECEQLYSSTKADSIRNISLDIRLQGSAGEDFPFECTGRHPRFEPRSWSQTTYLWKASGLCHKPLYFEQVQLERYGHDWGPVLQPLVSGAHFFGTVPILPYKMGLETPQECVYSLGYYRPGSCAPYMIEPLGFTWRAAAFEAGVATGAAAAIP
jgi:hypothetical protein